ncbi:MAG: tRNA epoxyqueuosine(34) reductase QueG [Pseudomonadota bacterium]
MSADPNKAKTAIKDFSRRVGFEAVGVAPAAADQERARRLNAFIDTGRHGSMTWMERRRAERAAPQTLWPEARSVIMLGMNYGPDHDPLAVLDQKDRACISVYAQNKDYHDVVKKRLKQIARWMVDEFNCDVKVFVDTAPVMEKPLAQSAGVGWQGKHTNLVSTGHGSWLFLGAIYTTLELPPDPIEEDHCGSCRRCLDVCPTDAFPTPYQLDARRCISYLTIEHDGPIPIKFRKAIGNRIYGCDDCLAVCPWNKFAATAQEAAFHARDTLRAPELAMLVRLDDAAFRSLFSGSPIKRIKRDRFVRNVLIAIGNSEDRSLAAPARELLDDPAPIVRGAAVWALSQLLAPEGFAALSNEAAATERDATVLAEWAAGAGV